MMNPEIKERWIAALRDPNAKQGNDVLGRSDGSRCCLGVLCDIAVADGVIEPPIPNDAGFLQYGPTASTSYLPDVVAEWADLEGDDPKIERRRLSHYNDGGSTFTEIAQLIETHL